MNYEDEMLVTSAKCSYPKHKIDFGSLNLFTENGILRIIEEKTEKYLSSLQVFAIVNFFAEYLKKRESWLF